MTNTARAVFDGIKILDTKEVGQDLIEVCAAGQAAYDEASSEMAVETDSFLRRFQMRGKDQVWHAPWLPRKDTVHTHVAADQAHEAAKEIFKAWGEKVRKSIPPIGEWNDHPEWLQPG